MLAVEGSPITKPLSFLVSTHQTLSSPDTLRIQITFHDLRTKVSRLLWLLDLGENLKYE